jgi:hypothetical protein
VLAGLYSPLPELVRVVPAYVQAVLLPFEGRIIIDGIVSSPGVQLHFGAGMRRTFAAQYAEARARSEIRTALIPSATARASVLQPLAKSSRAVKARSSSILGGWSSASKATTKVTRSGRGWAMLDDDDVLRGRLYIHRGDDSAFEAVRVQAATKTRRRHRGGG